MAIILQYGRHRLLLNAFYIKITTVSQKGWVGNKLYFDHLEWTFNVISSIKTFKYFQDGYSFASHWSPLVLFLNIAFSPSVIRNLIKYKVDLIVWNRHAIFKIAAIFQHHCHMPCMCICIGIGIFIGIFLFFAQNRRGILLKMVHEHGLHYFLWHITESICILSGIE